MFNRLLCFFVVYVLVYSASGLCMDVEIDPTPALPKVSPKEVSMKTYVIPKQSRVCVVNPQRRFVHPVRRLRHYLPECFIDEIDDVEALTHNQSDYVIVLADKEVKLPKEIEQPDVSELPEDGFLLKTSMWKGKNTLVALGGGLPGLIYSINELGENSLKLQDDSYVVPELNMIQKPALPYRLLWTWDHSTNWYLNQGGKQELGCFNNYMKPSSGFLEDYKRLVDFMSLNRISGVTIYGFYGITMGE